MSKKKASLSPEAKKRKVELQRLRREKYSTQWREMGIAEAVIRREKLFSKNPFNATSDFTAEIKKTSANYKRQRTRLINRNRREQALLDAGYKKNEIPKGVLHSDDKMYAFLGKTNPLKVYHAGENLALSGALIRGDMILNTHQYKDLTFNEIKEKINQRVKDWQNKPDNSDKIRVAFQIFHGTEDECEESISKWNERGYNLKVGKFTDRRYFRLVNRNDWNMREFGELMLCVLDQVHNEAIPGLYQQFLHFTEDAGLPFGELFSYSYSHFKNLK